ncbi:hypothetical protein BHE74_00008540 [Ensete ventricosum]|nr:hypothetical protein BHE74_00008540 [Ensete ventricosum]
MATSYEGTLRVDVEINLNEGLTRGMVGMRAPSTQCKSRSGATWVELSEVSKPHEGSRLILHGAKDEGSFKAHAPCLRDAFDGGTKAIQLAEVKLGSKGLCMGQEDVEVGMIGATRELDCFNAHIHLREPGKSEDKAERAQLPKSKASVRIEVDSEECHSAVEADPSITKKGMQMQDNG